jgi:hypothetical protein
MTAKPYYDPNDETDGQEQLVAAHWEAMRRNAGFREIAERWIVSEEFRHAHVETDAYHNAQVHFPRCSLDWMITSKERVKLSEFQREKLRWFRDLRYNFGPIQCRQNMPLEYLTRETAKDFVTVEPAEGTARRLKLTNSWKSAPKGFKDQFRFAILQPMELEEIGEDLKEVGNRLRQIAAGLAGSGPPVEDAIIAHFLSEAGTTLRDIGEFNRVFSIPHRNYSQNTFSAELNRIEAAFKNDGRIKPEKKYNLHKSYLGTAADWHWFLEAEHRGLDPRRDADAYALADLYSEDLRRQGSHRRKNAKSHGFQGTKVPAKAKANRRATIRRHIGNLRRWIEGIYPPAPLT